MLVQAASAPSFSPEQGLTRRILAHNARLMLVEHAMVAGWVGTRHSHIHDQLVFILSGRLRFECGGEVFDGERGDSFVLGGGIEHQAWALESSVVLDIFTPCREDFL